MAAILSARPVRSGPPAWQPISLAQLKEQVGIAPTITIHDDYLLALRDAAQELIEQETGLVLAAGPYRWELAALPPLLAIPIAPVRSIQSIEYRDPAGAWHVVDPDTYALVGDWRSPYIAKRRDASWPQVDGEPDGVRIQLEAGFTDAAQVPRRAIQAALLMVGHWFAARDPIQVGPPPLAAPAAADLLLRSLLRPTYP